MKYIVKDTCGKFVRQFTKESDALNYKALMGNPKWEVCQQMRQSSDKQQKAVVYCMNWNMPRFYGNIEDFDDCHKYLSEHLETAKQKEQSRRVYDYQMADIGIVDPYDCL